MDITGLIKWGLILAAIAAVIGAAGGLYSCVYKQGKDHVESQILKEEQNARRKIDDAGKEFDNLGSDRDSPARVKLRRHDF